jgi:hypothetical protein
MHCNQVRVLRACLGLNVVGQPGPEGNRQMVYRFDDGAVVATYDTGSVVFQGKADSPWVEKVKFVIEQINATSA